VSLARVPLVAGLLTVAAGALGAQTPDTTRRRAETLAPIVVTATRVPVAAVTSATTIITGDSLRRRDITYLIDALREVPGLAVVQTGSFGGLTAIYTRGGESGYTRVLLDGVPLNDPGGDFDFAHLTTEDIDRVEIVRGPASVLYGTDAVSGVIQIFTRRGEGKPRLGADLRGGSYGTRSATAGLRGGTENASYSLDAARYLTDGIYPFNNRYGRSALTGSMGREPGPPPNPTPGVG
jgi:vitamin B12 transporter